jgi:Arc/MetJ-type ribon-helix-helix transcriptional regulator
MGIDGAARRTNRATVVDVGRSLHVRLDDSSDAALRVLRAAGLNDSQAVRTALREAAARRRTRTALEQEARRVAADPADAEEMRAIREQMAKLAPPPGD